MGRLAEDPPNGDRAATGGGYHMKLPLRYLLALAIFAAVGSLAGLIIPITYSQSGRQQNANATAKAIRTPSSRPRQSTKPEPTPPIMRAPANANNNGSRDPDDVVRVSSHLVPVPTTVIDARGVAVPNLKLEDFELTVDGQAQTITDISHAETPVRLAMLFDNSGRL